MTIKTYPEMDTKVIELLRWDDDNPVMLYAAQRIEELELIAGVRYECLKMAIEALRWYGYNGPVLLCGKAGETLNEIERRLAELEQEKAQWTFGGNSAITPALQPLGQDGQSSPSSLSLETLLDELVEFYERNQDSPALQWDPYASRGDT